MRGTYDENPLRDLPILLRYLAMNKKNAVINVLVLYLLYYVSTHHTQRIVIHVLLFDTPTQTMMSKDMLYYIV